MKEITVRWQKLIIHLTKLIGKRPESVDGVLFLIGVQEFGKGAQSFSKEEKQDLIHIGICKVLSLSGFYELEGIDQDGWPHWKLVKKLPHFKLDEQEDLLKIHILDYFETEYQISF